ncbi:KAP family P-loop NTPase fold protein [Shewanella surugensis]|uniref:KAP family NTPase n=1 Tax=Shewanella surugensis TaxID=212020 RepID=A0ABT0LDL2_9GAMM|nr:KAP family NTPase [Shewanella surugensis]MCL1125791.1 KAP family NTPase [Shewanella surugensis]
MDITALTFDERDEFKRKSIAEKVMSLLQADIDISPIVIDGSWGTGKTEFCHKLINLMSDNNTHHLIYIDAFKADHANEPLMTLLAEIIKVLPDVNKQGFMKKALPAVRYGLKTIAKAGVSHLLRQDVVNVADDFDKELQKTADKAIDATIESVLKDHVKADQNLNALQTALAEIAANKPIILFVDELDRCRPNFAVDMLEIIKHTFDVEGVSFVLITNTQQLKAAVNHCYGDAVDAQRYLDKFLKFSFALPEALSQIGSDKDLASVKYFTHLIRQSSILAPTELYQERDTGFKFVKSLITVRALSLREVETFVRHLEIYQTLNSESDALGRQVDYVYRFPCLVAVYFHCFFPSVARSILRKNIDSAQLAGCFGINDMSQLVNETPRSDSVLKVIAMMLVWDCDRASSLFAGPVEQEPSPWVKVFHSYFSQSHWGMPDEGGCVEIVAQALSALNLNNNP